jgi:hypothetical protein
MSCEKCKNKVNDTTLNTTPNYTIEELQRAYEMGDRPSYTNDEHAWYYNLYNRVFKANKIPGCGKCFANIRKQLSTRYKAEKGIL